jgi:FKBP-type peptidyl-prolyl cis-trans isomerase
MIRKIRTVVFIFLATLIWVGCDDGRGPWQEQLIAFGEGDATIGNSYRAWSMVFFLNEQHQVIDSQYVYLSPQSLNNTAFQERVNLLHEGDIKEWEVVSETNLAPLLEVPAQARWQQIRCIQLLTEAEWKKQLMDLVQTQELSEEKAVEYYAQESFDERRPGLAWRWIRRSTSAPISDSAEVMTHIATTLCNGQLVGNPMRLQAKKGQPDQWAPAVQWVLKYLADGDSVEIIAKSEFAFGQNGSAILGIPGGTPLIFHLGVRSVE